jgi:hypothetical protein
MQKAQSTAPLLAQLHASSAVPVLVKYRLRNAKDEVEHVWGELKQISESSFTASLETPLVGGNLMNPPPYELPITALEDWQIHLPDGRIRGGYTTQAQIALTRESGGTLPPHIALMEGRFVDR